MTCAVQTSKTYLTSLILYLTSLQNKKSFGIPSNRPPKYLKVVWVLAALAALYLTLVSDWLGERHFRILTQWATFETWDQENNDNKDNDNKDNGNKNSDKEDNDNEGNKKQRQSQRRQRQQREQQRPQPW